VTYRWAVPDDTAPLLRLIDALGRDEIDLVAFTSASQASNLYAVAQDDGEEASLQHLAERSSRQSGRRAAPRSASSQ
jgi:uroporphyrinogen-III synthase